MLKIHYINNITERDKYNELDTTKDDTLRSYWHFKESFKKIGFVQDVDGNRLKCLEPAAEQGGNERWTKVRLRLLTQTVHTLSRY